MDEKKLKTDMMYHIRRLRKDYPETNKIKYENWNGPSSEHTEFQIGEKLEDSVISIIEKIKNSKCYSHMTPDHQIYSGKPNEKGDGVDWLRITHLFPDLNPEYIKSITDKFEYTSLGN